MKCALRTVSTLSIAALLNGCSDPFPEGDILEMVISHRIMSAPTGISFSDTNDRPRFVNGSITISAAPDQSTVGRYNLYWSAGEQKLLLIGAISAGGGTVTYTFPASISIPAGATHLLVASVDNYIGEITPVRTTSIVDLKVFYMFIASPALTNGNIDGLTTWNGHALSTYGTVNLNNGNPMEEADAICQAAAQNGNISSAGTVPTKDLSDLTYNTWKAMLVDGVHRQSPVAGSIDWIFLPDQIYRRVEDGATVGTTNSVGVFGFPLAVGFTSGNTESYWTGLTPTWGTSPNLCLNGGNPWNSALNGTLGQIGDLAIATLFNTLPPDFNAISESSVPCDSFDKLLVCVEQ